MATLAYPSGVPFQARLDSWQLQRPFRDALTTEVEDGARRTRQSVTKNIATMGFSIVPMTRAQFAAFKSWVRDDLYNGTWPEGFLMSVWTGDGYQERICHFAAQPPYQMQPEGFDQSSGQPYIVVTISALDVEDW